MTRLKFLFDEEEKEEELKPGWAQRTRGIGELPKFPKSTKLKFTADLGLGIGAKAEIGVILPEVEEPSVGVSQRMRGIGEIPKKYPFEGVTIDLKKAQKRFGELWRSEFMTTEDKWKFLRHENWSEELIQANRESMILSEKASKMGVNIKDWINYGVYMAFFVAMAASILPIVSGLPKNILNNLAYKVEGKTVKGKELLKTLQRVTYPDPRAGFGAPSKFDRKIFDEFVKQGGLKGIGKNLKMGVTITEIEPRFAFGTKLYAGLPADEIVKSLVKTGKITSDIARELSLAKPELVSQVIQNLSVASPAIASKLAPELVKLIPEVKPLEETFTSFKEKFKDKNLIYRNINLGELKEGITKKIRNFTNDIDEAIEFAEITAKQQEDLSSYLVVAKKPLKIEPRGDKWLSTQIKSEDIVDIYKMQWNKEQKKWKFTSTQAKPTPIEPIKPVEKIEPKVEKEITKVGVKPKVELATPAQIKEADIFAKEHKLITETPSGKISDLRYKRVAKNIIGKTSVKDMTKEEADEFIESIKGIVQRRPWEPPIIPLSTKIVPKEFFEIEFKEPGIAKIITPKKYYLRILGAEPLLKDLIDSKELLTLKTGEINKWVNDVIRKINKEATITQKFKARVFYRPTNKVATMRDLLNKYENPPDFLKPKEKEIFKEIRDFTKDMLAKTNEVRDRVGLEPIKEVKTYIPHFLDELAKQIVNKKYPFPEDVKYWLRRNMPKKIYNPTAMERRVRDDLEIFFSKDLGALLRTLAKYDLRDIYLSEPYSILRAELNALRDRIPASTRKEIDLFLRHDIFNYPTDLDQMLNKTLEKPTDVINFFLKPFNRIISNPISSLSNVYRQGLMGGAIAMKPRLVLRNVLTQKLLNMNIYPIKDYLKAQFWLTPKGVMDEIRDTTFYKLSIRKFEDLPPLLKPIQWGMYPYSKSHAGINYISNVDVSGKVGYYYGEDMIAWCETPKGKAYIEKYAKKHNLTGKAKDDLVWRKGDEKDEAVEAMSVTQWLYFSTDMPRVFRGKGARAFWSLQSWWMNWFGKHLREGLIRMGGKTSRGRIVRPGDRINLIKGLAVIFALTEAIRMKTGIDMKKFLFFPFPTYIFPPAMQLMLNTYYLITSNTDQKRKSAIRGLENNIKLLVPFSGAWKRYWQFIRGEITLKEWLFYMERKKKDQPPLKITIPKSGKLKFTEPKLDIKSTKLKFTF